MFEDPAGDQDTGEFDWTVGYAFTNQDSLYIQVEMTDPSAPYQMIDISISTPDHVYQIIWNQGAVSFPIDEWTGDDALTIGFAQASAIQLDEVLEARIFLNEINNPSSIESINVAVFVGEDWQHGDAWAFSGVPPFVDEADASTVDPLPDEITIAIDGYADDWKALNTQATDPSGDHTLGGVDLNGYTFFLSDSALYGMVSVHNWGLYEFIDFGLIDPDGVDHVVYLGTMSGVGGISRPGEYSFAIPVVATQGEVIEFKVALSDIFIFPELVQSVSICCDAEYRATDSILGMTSIPSIEQVDDQTQIAERTERPGPGYLLAEQTYPHYTYRSFIQNPERSTLGPDGNIYVSDNSGRHIVRLHPDGTAEDMGFWRGAATWVRHGPSDVAFGPDGTMYVADNAFIYRVLEDNSLEHLRIHGWPSAIEFGPDGLLYYIETIDWALYRWDFVNEPQFLVQIDDAHDFAFLHDGRIVVVQIGGKAYVVDPETGSSELFFEQPYTPDPIFVTVGPDGDVWIRAIHQVDRVGPDGIRKPIVVEGVEIGIWGEGLPADTDRWSMSGDIVFDESGRMWLFSGSSRIVRFTPAGGDTGWTMERIVPGFYATDLLNDGKGNLLALNDYSNELLGISPAGEVEVLFESPHIATRNGLAVDAGGRIYIGSVGDGIMRLEPDGTLSHYAGFGAHRMVLGSDGALYVSVTGRVGDNYEILRLTDVDTFTVFKTTLGGKPIGDESQALFLGNAPDGGLFAYEQRAGILYKLDLDGEEEVYYDFNYLGDGRPWAMGVSPQGIPFFVYHTLAQPGSVGYVSEDKELITVMVEAAGDPYGIDFNLEGDVLYVGAFGVIYEVPLHWGN